MQFSDLQLAEPIKKALIESGYKNPTPIQEKAIPLVMAGSDLLGVAQTGTGKTAAFSLPMIHRIFTLQKKRESRKPRALILTPTRELAIQIHESLVTYGKHTRQKYAVIFGGVGQGNQVKSLFEGVDVLVATPGRLIDLMEQRHVSLEQVEFFVLDEADRMLDMGFMRDVKRILPHLPQRRQSLFFSATMPSEIQKLASTILHDPKKVEVAPPSTTSSQVKQRVMFVEKSAKLDLLMHLLKDPAFYKVLVFVEMKHGADKVADRLSKARIPVAAIHGNKSQGARQKAIKDFEGNQLQVLVATDIVARGLDFDGVTHVINYELSNMPETYVHRIGRTGRASQRGESISFCTGEEKSFLFAIEKDIGKPIPVDTSHPYHSESAQHAAIYSAREVQAKRMQQREEFKRSRPRRGGGGPARSKTGGGHGGGPRKGSSRFSKKRR
ncbi:MAG: DEAD/DEAH box helicase [Pseudobdellovibrionaceae bacterium]